MAPVRVRAWPTRWSTRSPLPVERRSPTTIPWPPPVGGGNYARVFIGLATGWNAGASSKVTVEDIDEHLDAMRDTTDHTIPGEVADELELIRERLARRAG